MSPRPQAADRLRRVLAMVPYILEHRETTVADLSRAFEVSEADILADLAVLPFCGLPPYTPDRLMDVAVIEGHVTVRFAEYFERPLRLTAPEGFALLAAGRALLASLPASGGGPLDAALTKLEDALGAREVVAVEMSGNPEYVERLREAAEARERIVIDYYSFGRDAVTTREVEPRSIVSLRGHWYLAAHCHLAGDERLFRVDRIRAISGTGTHFETPSDVPPEDVFSPSAEHTRVTLDLPPEARWVIESNPAESVEERRGGRLRAVFAVAAVPWLERLLLQVGPEAEVVGPKEWKGVGAAAAERLLGRYGG